MVTWRILNSPPPGDMQNRPLYTEQLPLRKKKKLAERLRVRQCRSGEERLGQGLIINATTGAVTHGVLPGTELNLELLSVGQGSNSAVASAPNF